VFRGRSCHAVQSQQDGAAVCRTRQGKNLGGGLAELRVNELSQEGEVVLRIFFHPFGDRRIVILHGYDKGEDPAGSASSGRSLKPTKAKRVRGANEGRLLSTSRAAAYGRCRRSREDPAEPLTIMAYIP
jgi:phage-related protein